MILLDTNVLGRMTDSTDPQCAPARGAVQTLAKREQLVIVPQILYEFWAVATRSSARNGLGMAPEQASQWMHFFQRRFALLPDQQELFAVWHELVRTLRVTGLRSHDARLVATMQTYSIRRLLTFNAGDFVRFPVTLIDPAAV